MRVHDLLYLYNFGSLERKPRYNEFQMEEGFYPFRVMHSARNRLLSSFVQKMYKGELR